jgi:glycerol-3-phosphate acyltransferase PlsY
MWSVWFSMGTISLALALLASYAVGSLPPTYLVARWRKGIDLRRYGSGTVGGSNLAVQLGWGWAIVIGALDWVKGLAPALLARVGGLDWGNVALINLATVIGHNWSFYLGFKGGRGIAVTIGVLFVWDLRLALAFLVIIGIGWLIKQGAPSCMLALVLLAPTAWLIECPREIVWGSVGLLFIATLKRLEANRLPLPQDAREKRIVLWRRFWFDRDIPSDQLWQERGRIE